MASAKDWISAFRLRTLFLAASTVILGSGLALHEGKLDITIFIFAMILAVTIQILANLANDLGDFQKGTDVTGKRLGPTRAVQGGIISAGQMKVAIVVFVVLCILSGSVLVYKIAPYVNGAAWISLIFIGLLCIIAALFYTMGKHAYGYRGWGDIFAFLFFGPVPVIGTYYLHTHSLDFVSVLPAISIGVISTMILNINNMRDIENDRKSGKTTIAVKLGLKRSKIYHSILTFISFFGFLAFNNIFEPQPWYRYIYLFFFLLLFKMLREIRFKSGHELDSYLKTTSLSGLLIAISFVICINI
jgi:1,4-dihydroxy-2-naphthoate octaprenyltransferase